jgi:hypothetical protein
MLIPAVAFARCLRLFAGNGSPRTKLLRRVIALGVPFLVLGSYSDLLQAHAQATTAISLTVTYGGSAATTVTAGDVVQLTATVAAGSAAVSPGQIKFCDATAPYCFDLYLLGTAQLRSDGTAVLKFHPPVGSHSYNAVFVGTNQYNSSVSAASSLSVVLSGTHKTTTTIEFDNLAGGQYKLYASVTAYGRGLPPLTGSVSFVDTSADNAVVGTIDANGTESPAFTSAVSDRPALGAGPALPVAGDFNGDGNLDLAILNQLSSSVSILLGHGDGRFSAAPVLSLNPAISPSAITVADFNSDGLPDLAITDNAQRSPPSDTVRILLNNGDGTFRPAASSPAIGSGAVAIVSGDWNGDGIVDLAVLNRTSESVTILLGAGDGTFTSAKSLSTGSGLYPEDIAVGDFNKDGKPDLIISNALARNLKLFLGNGDATFTLSATGPFAGSYAGLQYVEPSKIRVVDLDGDGNLDLILNHDPSTRLAPSYVYGNGDGTFTTLALQPGIPDFILGNFNGDGLFDRTFENGTGPNGSLFTTDDGVPDRSYVFRGGAGSFLFDDFKGAYSQTGGIASDFDGDGISDLAILGASTLDATLPGSAEIILARPFLEGGGSTTVTLSPGPHTIVASYLGDDNYISSTSSALKLNGAPATTALALAVSSEPYSIGQPMTLTATLSPYTYSTYTTDGESISFYDGATLVGTGTLSSGVATATLTPAAAGIHNLTAKYSGETIFAKSTSNLDTIIVATATTLSLSSSGASSVFGNAITLTAKQSPTSNGGYTTNNLAVTFYDGSVQLGSSLLLSGVATFKWVPAAGTHTISAQFGGNGYFLASQSGDVTITVAKAKPSITWPTPVAIAYGTPLSSTQLNASTSVAGAFTYSPAAGTVLSAGTHSLTVTFTPTDTLDYTTNKVSVSLTVNKATPTITWATPASITYGTGLGATQLDATAKIPGTFTYSPAAGSVLSAGTQTLTVTFTPTNTADYTTNKASVSLTVNKATPTITWATPASITYGTALSATQLDATAKIPGTFTYSPAAGTDLSAGQQTLAATFNPTDTTDYASVEKSVVLAVYRAAPILAWPVPAAITYGTALSSAQLDTTTPVPGAFTYSPATGTVLGVGTHTLYVTFTPTDAVDYKTSQAHVSLTVNKATPAITWPKPAAITYGTALSATQLDATADVAGTFTYSPATGAVLSAGYQTLTVTFTPKNSNFLSVKKSVVLLVNRAKPVITWQAPDPITYGTALSATQLDATASVPGTFTYTPAAGTVLGVGTHALWISFTPTDSTDYNNSVASVILTVNKAQ